MGLFQNIGLAKKKPRPVGQSLEKGRESPRRARRAHWAFKIGILLILEGLTLAAFPRDDIYRYTLQVGDEWRREDFEAPFDFPLYKTDEQLQNEREEIRRTTPPIFQLVDNAQEQMEENRDLVAAQLAQIFSVYVDYRLNQLRGRTAEALEDSIRYMELRRAARLKATPEQWQILAESHAQRIPELPTSSRQPPEGPSLGQQLLQDAWEISAQLLVPGVLDVHIDSVRAEEILIRNLEDNTETIRSKRSVYGLNEAYAFAETRFEEMYADRQVANLGSAFFRAIFTPSLRYLLGATVEEWRLQEQALSITQGRIAEGEVIVRKGQTITESIKQQLTSLERYRQQRGGDNILWRVVLGQFLVSLITYFIFFLYLYLLRRSIFDDNRQMLLIAILFAVVIGMFAIALRLEGIAMYIVPVAIAPVLFTVMFDSRVGLFAALALGMIGGQLLNYDFEFAFATIVASTLGVFSVRDIKNRGQFFISAGLVLLGYVIVLGATAIFFGVPREMFFSDLILVAVNSFLLIVAYPLVWVFERLFSLTTDLTLLELSDTNRPLLKELSLRAPGTFNHSLQVANLAEAAADAVGANALLTRVGALYHDIGKMLKPEYFVENQRPDSNPHTQLKPRMSALIIASHVKEGLEMGRQYNLPQRVLDFIPMHHGTTRIEFFYRKAVDQRKEGDPEILESEFRYPGPRPDSKETGILMLADSIEAASRSLTDPTHKRLETLIDMIFTARIEDGQLDRTDLTFRDLSQIKETFLSMLLGIYHVRVKYPGQDQEGGDSGLRREAEQKPPTTTRGTSIAGGTSTAAAMPTPSTRSAESAKAPNPTSRPERAGEETESARVHREEAERVRLAREKAAQRGAGPRTDEEVGRRARGGSEWPPPNGDESEAPRSGKGDLRDIDGAVSAERSANDRDHGPPENEGANDSNALSSDVTAEEERKRK